MTGIASQVFVVPFIQGLNSKESSKNPATAGRLLQAVNVNFSKPGEVSSRSGFELLANSIAPGGDKVQNGIHLQSFGNELVLFDGTDAFSYNPGSLNWIHKGYVPTVSAHDRVIANNDRSQCEVTSAHLNGTTLFVWRDKTNDRISCCSIDEQTGTILLPETLLCNRGSHPRCVSVGGLLVVFYCSGLDIKHRTYDPVAATAIGPEETSVGTHSNYPSPFLDVAVKDGTSVYAFFNSLISGVPGVRYVHLDVSNGFFSSTLIAIAPDSQTTHALAVCTDHLGEPWFLHYGTQNEPAISRIFASSQGRYVQVGTMPAFGPIPMATIIETDPVKYEFSAMLTIPASPPGFENTSDASTMSLARFRYDIVSTAITMTSGPPYRPGPVSLGIGASLASKAFIEHGLLYVQLVQHTRLQATYFTFNVDNLQVVSRDRVGFAGDPNTQVLPDPFTLSPHAWGVACSEQNATIGQGGQLVTKQGAACLYLDFAPVISSVELDKTLLVAGACPQSYDGVRFVEQGFNSFPESVSVSFAAGGGIPPGTRQYCAVYAWRDGKGKVCRSKPTPAAVQVTNTVAGSYTVFVPTLHFTKKPDVWVEVYRTANVGTTFYLVTNQIDTLPNDTKAMTVGLVDGKSDELLQANNLILYTSLSSKPYAPLSACTTLATYNNRFFAGDLSWDGSTLEFSELSVPSNGLAIEFHDEFTLQVDTTGGSVVAMKQLDSNLIVFKESLSYTTQGDGPAPNGGGQYFSTPQLIATDTGCRDPNSVVLTPVGLVYKSDKGLYQLDRGGSAKYIGAPVEDFNDLTVTGAVLLADTNQIRFTTSPAGSPGLMYDYYTNAWSTYSGHDAASCCSWLQPDGSGRFVMLKHDGHVWAESADTSTDPIGPVHSPKPYPFMVESGWIQPMGQHGWFRARSVHVLGEYLGPHKLLVELFFDFNDDPKQAKTIGATHIHNTKTTGNQYVDNLWGTDCTWGGTDGTHSGSLAPFGLDDAAFGMGANLFGMSEVGECIPTGSLGDRWGGRWAPYAYRVKCGSQKTTAVKVRISEVPEPGFDYGPGLSINSIAIDFAPLPGTMRMSRNRTF